MKLRFLIFYCLLFVVPASLYAQETEVQISAVSPVKTMEAPFEEGMKPLTVKGAPLPPITLITAEHTRWSSTAIQNGKTVILVLFNPGCDHCREVAELCQNNKDKFKSVQWIFACGMNLLGDIPAFLEASKLQTSEQVFMGAMPEDMLNQLFRENGIPQIMMYNAEHKLSTIHYKSLSLKQVMDHIQP